MEQTPLKQKVKLQTFCSAAGELRGRRTPVSTRRHFSASIGDLRAEVIEQVEINAKYDGYIEKERSVADKLTRLEDVPLEA